MTDSVEYANNVSNLSLYLYRFVENGVKDLTHRIEDLNFVNRRSLQTRKKWKEMGI